jgi:hypothetical protein
VLAFDQMHIAREMHRDEILKERIRFLGHPSNFRVSGCLSRQGAKCRLWVIRAVEPRPGHVGFTQKATWDEVVNVKLSES